MLLYTVLHSRLLFSTILYTMDIRGPSSIYADLAIANILRFAQYAYMLSHTRMGRPSYKMPIPYAYATTYCPVYLYGFQCYDFYRFICAFLQLKIVVCMHPSCSDSIY